MVWELLTSRGPFFAADVSVYTLMNLLGHESVATSQRYVTASASTDYAD